MQKYAKSMPQYAVPMQEISTNMQVRCMQYMGVIINLKRLKCEKKNAHMCKRNHMHKHTTICTNMQICPNMHIYIFKICINMYSYADNMHYMFENAKGQI